MDCVQIEGDANALDGIFTIWLADFTTWYVQISSVLIDTGALSIHVVVIIQKKKPQSMLEER